MANVIQIKRSAATTIPTSLAEGELAYSEKPTIDKLYVGVSGASIHTIGGKYYTDKIDQAVLVASSPVFADVELSTGGGFRTGQTATNTVLLQAYDVDGASYTTFGTLTANNTPTFDLATSVTVGGQLIVVDSDIGSSVQAFGAVLDDLNTLGANAADSEFLVGTGAGALAWESGATARTSLGVAIGTDVQAFSAALTDLDDVGVVTGDGDFLVGTAAGAFAWESGATARASLGLTIGTHVQAFGAALDDINTLGANTGDNEVLISTGAGVLAWESGATLRTSIGLTIGSDVQAFGALLDDLNTLGANSADSEFLVGTGAGALTWESGGTVRISLGLAIGTDVQAFGAVLDDLNTLGANASDGEFLVGTGAGALAWESGATARASLGAVNINGDTMTGALTLSGDPSSDLHAATKQYVDNRAAGLDPKASCAVATTANITLSGEQTIDGVLTSSSRVLVKDQSSGSENGIYVSAAGAWSRATDADADLEVTSGMYTMVVSGTVNSARGFIITTPDPITVDTTAITFSEFSDFSGSVLKADYNANTILYATADDTPAALTVTEQTLVGRITSGNIAALSTTQIRTLINVEDGATADQSDAEIETAYNAQVAVVTEGVAQTGTSSTVYRWTPQRVTDTVTYATLDGGSF